VVRGHAGDAEHVVVLATLGAPERRRLGRRGPRPAPAGPPPAAVATGRATVVDAVPFAGPSEAERWLGDVDAEAHAAAALAVLDRLLHLHRLAAADPRVPAPARGLAVALRVGIGEGEDVAEGRWRAAVDVPPARPRRRREAALRPQERLAALLGGRDVALACETLALRAREDLDAGRVREAALQLDAALAAAGAELAPWRGRGGLAARLDELGALRDGAAAAADAAREGGLDDDRTAAVAHALARLEAALRARTALGFDG
jgi:hypothetical protein